MHWAKFYFLKAYELIVSYSDAHSFTCIICMGDSRWNSSGVFKIQFFLREIKKDSIYFASKIKNTILNKYYYCPSF